MRKVIRFKYASCLPRGSSKILNSFLSESTLALHKDYYLYYLQIDVILPLASSRKICSAIQDA